MPEPTKTWGSMSEEERQPWYDMNKENRSQWRNAQEWARETYPTPTSEKIAENQRNLYDAPFPNNWATMSMENRTEWSKEHSRSPYTREEIDEALAAVDQRQNTLAHRQLNKDPLVSEHDTGVSLTAEGYNTIINAGANEVSGPGDEDAKDILELLAATPDPADPSKMIVPALEDPEIAQGLGITETPNGFVPFRPLSDNRRKEILSDVASTKGWTYENINKARLEDVIKNDSGQEAKDAAAWSLVIDYGWTPKDFSSRGVPISNLSISRFTDAQWKAYSLLSETTDGIDLIEYMNLNPQEQGAYMNYISQSLQAAISMNVGPDSLTLNDLKIGGVSSFNNRYGTDYKTWDALTRAFANKTMNLGQANAYIRLWTTAKRMDSTSKSNADTNTKADNISEASLLIAQGQSATTDDNIVMQAFTGSLDGETFMNIRNNPLQYSAVNNIFDSQVLSGWAEEGPWQGIIIKQVRELLGPEATEEEAMAEFQRRINPMSYIGNGKNFFDYEQVPWASYSGYQLGQHYSAMVGKSESAQVNKLIRSAMLGIERWKQTGASDPKTAGYLHFLMGIHMGAVKAGDDDLLEDLFKSAGLTAEGAHVTKLFLAHAQEAWGPLMAGDEVAGMSDIVQIVESRFLGLMNAVSIAASAGNLEQLGLPTDVARDIREIDSAMFALDDTEMQQIFDPEVGFEKPTRSAMGATKIDELYKIYVDIGIFDPGIVSSPTKMHDELWQAYSPVFGRFLTEEIAELDTSEKLAYGFRMIMSDRILAQAFKSSLYAAAIHNKAEGGGIRMNAHTTASMMNVFLARGGFTWVPMQTTSDGKHIIPVIVAAGPNWTGTHWISPTREAEDSRKTNGIAWNGTVGHLFKTSSSAEAQKHVTGIVSRNYINNIVGVPEADIRRLAAEVYQEEVVQNKYTPTLIDLHFALAIKLRDKGLANATVITIAEWGKQRLEQARTQGLDTLIIPQRNEIGGTALGVRGNPHIRIRQVGKKVGKQGGFFTTFGSRDELGIVFDIPWWEVHDSDMAAMKHPAKPRSAWSYFLQRDMGTGELFSGAQRSMRQTN